MRVFIGTWCGSVLALWLSYVALANYTDTKPEPDLFFGVLVISAVIAGLAWAVFG